MRSSSTPPKPTKRTHPAELVQLIRSIEQPVVRRPVHAVRLLRFAHTVITSELPPDFVGLEASACQSGSGPG